MRCITLIVASAIALPSAHAGWFSYDSWEECFLDQLDDCSYDDYRQCNASSKKYCSVYFNDVDNLVNLDGEDGDRDFVWSWTPGGDLVVKSNRNYRITKVFVRATKSNCEDWDDYQIDEASARDFLDGYDQDKILPGQEKKVANVPDSANCMVIKVYGIPEN